MLSLRLITLSLVTILYLDVSSSIALFICIRYSLSFRMEQIQKGANPEKAAKRGYEQACECLDFWNKSVLIQYRALTCLSKSLAPILQRELYTMGNTGFLGVKPK